MLRPGASHLSTVSLMFERDTRSDPVLPTRGTRVLVVGEIGNRLVGSSWEYYKLTVRWQSWFPLRFGHIISAHALIGGMIGDAPVFERYFIGDLNPLIAQRALGLTLSTQPSRNLLGLGAASARWGTLAGRAGIEYLWPLFRGGRFFYGGHLFAGIGLLALADAETARQRDLPLRDALPLDLWFDAGLVLDTTIGVFHLSVANILGRLPL
jgi:outer membrane protein assembly factor BamA